MPRLAFLTSLLPLVVACSTAPVAGPRAAPPRPPPSPAQPCTFLGERAGFDDAAILDLYLRRRTEPLIVDELVAVCSCSVRSLGGDVEERKLGGDVEDRSLGGDVEDRSLGGDVEDRSLGGDVEDRSLGGDVEDRSLGGDVEDRKLGGDVEDRKLGGDVEDRKLGGNAETLTCRVVAECDGFTVSGQGPLLYFDGSSLRQARGRCVE